MYTVMKHLLFILVLPIGLGCELLPDTRDAADNAYLGLPVVSTCQSAEEDYQRRVELGMSVTNHRFNHVYRRRSQNDIFTRARTSLYDKTVVRADGSSVRTYAFWGSEDDQRWKTEKYFDHNLGVWRLYANELEYLNR